jgi:hypothetical protein
MSESNELEDLENLVKSPGWHWIERIAHDKINADMRQALDQLDDDVVVGKLRQLAAGRRALEWILDAPKTRVKTLQHQAQPTAVGYSRGGL